MSMTTDVDGALAALAPSGRLRAAINLGNAALARCDPVSGEVGGVSAALASELGRKLGCPVTFVTYASAGKVFDAKDRGEWDVAFLAIDAMRAEQLAFSLPYVAIEGTFIVPVDSVFRSVEDVDSEGCRICATTNAAYDLFLTRTLKRAQIVRVATPSAALELFVKEGYEAAAGVRQPLEQYVRSNPNFRVLPGHFTMIEQAIAIPKTSAVALEFLDRFIEDVKSTGFVRRELDAAGQIDVQVASG
jgi:polar amino acid transport system substrate-binding protein